FAHLQLLFGIEPPELLDVHLDALSLQHHMDTTIAEPAPLGCNGLHRLSQLAVVRPQAAIPHARSIHSQSFTRPPLAHPMHQAGMSHRISLCVGRHHFFAATSLRMALSSIASANSFLSRVFSSSSVFSRRASDTSRPPYLAFHL